MKRALFIFFTSLILLCLVGCNSKYPQAPLEQKPIQTVYETTSSDNDIGVQSLIRENEWYTISVHYPVTGYDFIDSQLDHFVNARIDTYESNIESLKSKETEPPKLPYELHITYEVPYRSNTVLGVQFTERKFTGGTSDAYEVYTFNFDLKKKQQYKIQDVLIASQSNANVILYELSQGALDDALKSEFYSLIEPIDSFYTNFILTNFDLKIWLNPSQLKYQTNAPITYTIPISKLMKYMTLKINLGYALRDDKSYLEIPNGTQYVSENIITIPQNPGDVNKPVGSYREKKIALTFEGGPHPIYTPIILETLHARDVRATFFFMGKRAKEYPEIVMESHRLGHDIGNGSYSYAQMLRLPESMLNYELEATQNIIYNLTGKKPYLFRPPFGQHDEQLLQRADMPIILWNVDPVDKVYNDPNYITSHILAYASDGGIVRLNDTQLGTAQAIGTIIDSLQEAGYEIVPVSELLDITAQNASKQLRVYNSKD